MILSKLFSYGYKITIARVLGAEIYGLYSLAFIVIGFFSAFMALGLQEGLTRFIPFYRGKKEYSKISHILKVVLRIFIVTGLLGTIILFGFSDWIANGIFQDPGLENFLKIMSIAIPFSLLGGVFINLIRSFERIKTYSFLVNIFQNGIKLLLLGILIFLGFKVQAVALSYLFAFIALFFVGYFFSRNQIHTISTGMEISKEESKKTTVDLFTYSWPLVFVGIVYSLFYWTDSLVLGYFKTATDVGYYNSAITIISLFGIAPDLFMQLFFPLISNKLSQNKFWLIKNLTRQVTKWVYLLGMPLFILVFAFPEEIILALFGPEFIVAALPLRILSFGGIFSSFIGMFMNLISINGETKLVLTNFILFMVFNLLLDLALIPPYGLTGAAIATTISWTIFAVAAKIQVRKSYKFSPVKMVFLKITLMSSLPFVFALLVSKYSSFSTLAMLLFSAFFFLLYFGFMKFMKIFDKADFEIFEAIKNKISKK